MSGDIARYRGSGAIERRHSYELDVVYNRAEVAEAQVAGINQVTKRAMWEALSLNLLRAQAERLAPDGCEHYALLALTSVSEMAQVIAKVRGGRR